MIRLGVHYEYPFGGMAQRDEWLPRGPDDWRRDCEAIRNTGFNIIRIRIGQDSDLDEVAQLLDIAHAQDLDVLFGFATFYVPYWFIEKYPDSRTVDRDGKTLAEGPLDYRWPRVCINHPEYRRSRNSLVDACAGRFMDHPAVTRWDVHNEPCLAHGGYPCYCTYTVATYRDVARTEFASIADFNTSTGQNFADFDAIEPPRNVEGAEAAWRHWREFMTANLSQFLLEAREIVKRHNADALVTYNVDPVSPWRIQQNVVDWWTSRELDFATTSQYAGSDEATASSGVNIAVLKELAGDREVWVTEFQGGPSPSANEIFKNSWTGKDIEIEMNSLVSYGLRGLIFYRWDPLISGQETGMMAMTDAGDYNTERRVHTKAAIERLQQFEPILDSGNTRPPSVGIYLRKYQLHHAEERRFPIDQFRGPLYDAMRGHYAIWTELGYGTGVIADDPDPEAHHEMVSFPYMYETRDTAAVNAVLGAGKRAVLELPARDLERATAVGSAFGLEVRGNEFPGQYHPSAGWNLRAARARTGARQDAIVGYAHDSRVILNESESYSTLLRYGDNGAPAVIAPREYGERLLIFTFSLGYSYNLMRHWGLRQFLGTYVGRWLKPEVQLTGVAKEMSSLVEARLLESDVGALVFLLNRSHYDYDVEVTVEGYRAQRVVTTSHSVTHVPLAPG